MCVHIIHRYYSAVLNYLFKVQYLLGCCIGVTLCIDNYVQSTYYLKFCFQFILVC